MIDQWLTPDPNISDALADILASNHESFIELYRALADDPDTSPTRRDQFEAAIEQHTHGLVQLGRPRVALDLRAKGWELDTHNSWRRRFTPDEYPFPIEEVDINHVSGWVYAEHNQHARMLDGTVDAEWGVDYKAEYYVA